MEVRHSGANLQKKALDETGKKVISGLDSYLRFIGLYKKERPSSVKSIIEQIVKEDKSIVSRIKKIEEIDLNLEEGVEHDFSKFIEKKEKLKGETKEAVKLAQGSFLNYLFVYRNKLIEFGVRTKTINFDFFGLKKRKSTHSIALWEGVYSDVKQYLYKEVNYVLLNAWRETELLPYNIVVVFHKFIYRLIRVGNLINNDNSYYRNTKVVDLFIEPYLTILYNSDYKEILKGTLFKILSSHEEYKQHITKTIAIVDGITNIERRSLSFFNVILAFYSISYNRFVKYEELITHYGIEEIPEEHFNFSQGVLNKIQKSIEDMNISIQDTEDELLTLKYISPYEDEDEDEDDGVNPWVSVFNALSNYEYHIKKTSRFQIGKTSLYDKDSFSTLLNNVLLGLVKVSKGFVLYYGDILKDLVSVGDSSSYFKVRIFDNAFLGDEINELELLVGEYSYRTSINELVDIEKYYLYLSSRELPIKGEEKLCKVIERIVYLYKDIAYKLCNVLILNKNALFYSSSAELLEKHKSKDEVIEEAVGKPPKSRFIPHYSDSIILHPFLDGRKVIDVIDEVVFFALNTIYFLRDNDIVRRYSEKDVLIENMEYYLNIKGKIAL